jgi:hypothetical protein
MYLVDSQNTSNTNTISGNTTAASTLTGPVALGSNSSVGGAGGLTIWRN